MQLVRQPRCSVYGPILAGCLTRFSWDLVDLVCGYIYPEALPAAVQLDLATETVNIPAKLEASLFYRAMTAHVTRVNHCGIQYWCIADGMLSSSRVVPMWVHEARWSLRDFERSQRTFSYKVSYEEERAERLARYQYWHHAVAVVSRGPQHRPRPMFTLIT